MALQFRKVGKAPRATRKQMGLAPVLPPNHCSHVVRFYTHRSKAAPCALRPDGTMTKLLNAYRAEPTIKIWAQRWSVARGMHWVVERECMDSTVNEWLAVFRKAEPAIKFVASTRRPRLL